MITGGAGFIGHHLVQSILKYEPGKLIIVDDLSTGLSKNIDQFVKDNKIEFILSKTDNLSDNDLPTTIDYIFHLAAVVSVPLSIQQPFQCHKINELGFLNILEIASLKKVKKIIFASSSAVYGEQASGPIAEQAILKCQSPYAYSKQINELHAQSYAGLGKVDSLGFRFFNVYGSGQRADSPYSGVISIFTDRLRQNKPVTIFGDGKQLRDFVHVQDVVEALVAGALSKRANSVYNVGTGVATSINKLLFILQDLLKTNQTVIYKVARNGDIKESLANIKKIANELNYSPKVNLKVGLRRLISDEQSSL